MKNGRASRIGDFLIFFDLDIYQFTKLTSRTAIKAMDSMVILCSPYLRMCWGILPHEQSGTERNWNCWKVFWCLPIPSLCLCAILSNWLNDLTFPVHGFVHTIIQISYIYIYYNGWCLFKNNVFQVCDFLTPARKGYDSIWYVVLFVKYYYRSKNRAFVSVLKSIHVYIE